MVHPPSFDNGRPAFDHAFADELIGKRVLVGLTYQDRRGEARRQEQFFGMVSVVDASRGIALSLGGNRSGETKWLPPDTRPFQAATKGEYRLRSTGEVVTDPDFTAQWTVTVPET